MVLKRTNLTYVSWTVVPRGGWNRLAPLQFGGTAAIAQGATRNVAGGQYSRLLYSVGDLYFF